MLTSRRVPFGAGAPGVALTLLAVAAVIIGGVEVAVMASRSHGPFWIGVLLPATGLVYVGSGILAWWRRPTNRLGAIMVWGGLTLFTTAFGNVAVPGLDAVGVVLATLTLAVAVHLLLAFPSGRLLTRSSRSLTAAAYLTSTVLQVPLYLFRPPASPDGVLAVTDHPGLAHVGLWVQDGVGGAILLGVAVLLTRRLRRATSRQRRVGGPLYLYGVAAVLAVPLTPDLLRPWWGLPGSVTTLVQVLVVLGLPIAFLIGLGLGGFARTGGIEELGAWLGTSPANRPLVTEALSRALGDESLVVGFQRADGGGVTDLSGKPVDLSGDHPERGVAHIDLGGRPIGAVVYDSVLISDVELVRTAGRVAALAADHESLTAEVLASRDELRRAGARIVEAGDRERRRIAQNLHDGLQTQLVLLAIEAGRLAASPDLAEETAQAAREMQARIDAAASDLRVLVHEVMPAALIERGLGAAVQDLVDRMPIPTRLEVDLPGSVPDDVSATAYFIVAEALANTVKHSRARRAAVCLRRHGRGLVIEVDDDGIGGAGTGHGLGLRSLVDRVGVLDGHIAVDSPVGEGTRVRAELQCGS